MGTSTHAADARDVHHTRAFFAGAFSGVTKLGVGHPFDTIKVRLQTSSSTHFSGPWDCVAKTLRHEGVTGFYKGATPPLVGWMFMDSVMLGSLTFYRRELHRAYYADYARLPTLGHAAAGVLAGWTVSFIAAPVEHVKARLQVQYAATRENRVYAGPVDCVRKLLVSHGVRGLYAGLGATLLFRTFFFFWWGSYDVFSRALQEHTALSPAAVNFWAGGLSAQVFWLTSYPSDVVKQRVMTDGLGRERRYATWRAAATSVYAQAGWRGYFRGFVPCFLRAFPTNAAALVAFETVMRA